MAGKGLAKAKISGDVRGGSGAGSGSLSILGGNITSLTLANLIGGSANGSGAIITDGILSGVKISQDVIGGNSAAGQILQGSGYIQAWQIASLVVGGTIHAGTNAGATSALLDSGAVRATENILSLSAGNLTGTSTNNVIIAAGGFAAQSAGAKTDLAINKLTVSGNVSRTEILAGYGLVELNSTDALLTDPRGAAVDADAQIDSVSAGGTWSASSLVAGASAGADGQFGTTDDHPINGAGSYNGSLVSKISSVIVKGLSSGSSVSTEHFGIVAQYVVSAKFNGAAVPLIAGSSNDKPSDSISFQVGEV